MRKATELYRVHQAHAYTRRQLKAKLMVKLSLTMPALTERQKAQRRRRRYEKRLVESMERGERTGRLTKGRTTLHELGHLWFLWKLIDWVCNDVLMDRPKGVVSATGVVVLSATEELSSQRPKLLSSQRPKLCRLNDLRSQPELLSSQRPKELSSQRPKLCRLSDLRELSQQPELLSSQRPKELSSQRPKLSSQRPKLGRLSDRSCIVSATEVVVVSATGQFPRLFCMFNRDLFCSMDRWYALTLTPIRLIKDEAQQALDEKDELATDDPSQEMNASNGTER
ncbi:hypothetical protein niasHT_001979 [Heterodera trifolii]|uniref:Phosphatidylinositol transfer protein N-terminal domain-containing protein n=1 Tax=Heterodera trifolii TaxID=157864 RepID=A0ABD2M382_9BILA